MRLVGPVETSRSDVVVVGCGVAGLTTALYADGRTVTVLSSSRFARGGSSVLAQGGVAVALGGDDSPACHAADTVAAGCGLTDPEVARLVTREGPQRMRELLRLGARLDRDRGGRLALGQEAAHSRRRVAHAAGDATGAELVRTLAASVSASERIRVAEETLAVELVLDDRGVAGVLTVNRDGRWTLHAAAEVVLATGGVGRLYSCTTNPVESTGDGLAMAARVGASLADLEFVQFHPTALADGSDPMALLTEALRGEGAVLIDENGERVMSGVHPALELAPRDVVARSIWRHRREGHGVFLDATGLGVSLERRFPTVLGLCRARGLDPRVDPVPVSPAAHYHMGGVVTDDHGRTSVDGLWACGEVAWTGLHGANRLASNSLLEALVYGARAGEALSALRLGRRGAAVRPPVPSRRPASGAWPWRADDARVSQLRRLMWREVGVERSAASLGQALEEIGRLEQVAENRVGELANLLLVARLVTTAALTRQESRGAHRRTDHPVSSPGWQRHLVFVGQCLQPSAALQAVAIC